VKEEYLPCEWPKCSIERKFFVEYGCESIWVCSPHRGAVRVNIERYNKIWIFKKVDQQNQERLAQLGTPGQKKPVNAKKPIKEADKPTDWEKEAAKRAEAAATPVNPVSTIVQPRKRHLADEALSRLFGPKHN